MDFETIKNNAMNAFRQLSVLRVIVTSPNEKVADVPALYALAAVLLAPWVCGAALVLGFLFHYGIRFEKDAVKMNLEANAFRHARGAPPPSKREAFEQERTNPNRDEPLKGASLFFFVKLEFSEILPCLFRLYQ